MALAFAFVHATRYQTSEARPATLQARFLKEMSYVSFWK